MQAKEKKMLEHTVHEAYMEIFPTPTIESKLDVLEAGSYVAVTCSPSKGVNETLQMSERLANRGFKVVPHIAAKMVRDETHLQEILEHLNDLPIISIFVPGGDGDKPAGTYTCALDLLRAISQYNHKFTEIGVAAHPEGHPAVGDDVLLKDLLKKQEYSSYLVTQMCFDAKKIGDWLSDIRNAGVTLPAWIGLPGISDRSTLLRTSMRIGVGDSLRYLKNNAKIAARLLKEKSYRPDGLLIDLAPYMADPFYNIEGHHIYCFNQVARTEEWRREFLVSFHGKT